MFYNIFKSCGDIVWYTKHNSHVHSLIDIDMQDWDGQTATNVVSEICGFITILSGTILLHSTKDSSDNRRSGISKCYINLLGSIRLNVF